MNPVISSSLAVWFMSFDPRIPTPNQIAWFFNIKYLQNFLSFNVVFYMAIWHHVNLLKKFQSLMGSLQRSVEDKFVFFNFVSQVPV